MMEPIILDLCGGTGAWSAPWKESGEYDVRLITLPKNDVRNFYIEPTANVVGILAAPPCTQFSWARTNAKSPRDLEEGMEIVKACLEIIWKTQYALSSLNAKKTRLKFWALENPYYGFLPFFLGKPVFEFQPWQFGDHYQKRTALWGNFNKPKYRAVKLSYFDKIKASTNSQKLPKFDRLATKDIAPEMYGKLNRQARRAITPRGFAQAFYDANKIGSER